MSRQIEFIDARTVRSLVTPAAAVAAIRATLQKGYRPETDHRRLADRLANGEFLLMPSETPDAVGVKVLTVAPHNPAHGRERIQGVYLVFDREHLEPTHLIDGPALTELRTAAVSIAAVEDFLMGDPDPLDVVLFGAGPQSAAHLATLRAVLEGSRAIASVSCITRNPDRAARQEGVTRMLANGSDEAREAVRRAGLIICATTARTALFDGSLVRDDAVVIAVGSHEPDARELDSSLIGRADVIVEDTQVALTQCGDVIMAIRDGVLRESDLLPMAEVVLGSTRPAGDRAIVFKSAGMPWEDLAIARAITVAYNR